MEEQTSFFTDSNSSSVGKADKFRKLAVNRTNTILETTRLLGNLANTNVYAYTAEEVDKIFTAIDEAVTEARTKFMLNLNKSAKERNKFVL